MSTLNSNYSLSGCMLVYQGVDNSQLVQGINEQIESFSDSIGFAQDNINECQTNITHYEESKVSQSPVLFLVWFLNSSLIGITLSIVLLCVGGAIKSWLRELELCCMHHILQYFYLNLL